MLRILFIVIALCSAGAASAKELSAKETTAERVLRTGEIRCAYADNPPVFAKDPNTSALSGIFYDVMTEVGRRLNVKINWVEAVG